MGPVRISKICLSSFDWNCAGVSQVRRQGTSTKIHALRIWRLGRKSFLGMREFVNSLEAFSYIVVLHVYCRCSNMPSVHSKLKDLNIRQQHRQPKEKSLRTLKNVVRELVSKFGSYPTEQICQVLNAVLSNLGRDEHFDTFAEDVHEVAFVLKSELLKLEHIMSSYARATFYLEKHDFSNFEWKYLVIPIEFFKLDFIFGFYRSRRVDWHIYYMKLDFFWKWPQSPTPWKSESPMRYIIINMTIKCIIKFWF